MRSSFREIAFVLLCVLLFAGGIPAAEPNVTSPGVPAAKAAVIICKDMIDYGLYKSICRRTEIALNEGAEYLIYEINTLGGALDSAYDISEYFLHETNLRARTVAYIPSKAVSAGALISVACEDIVMKEQTRIGDCAPIALGAKLEGVEREKIESDIRTVFANSAQANGYPEALLKAMVTRELEVYSVRNIKTDRQEYFESADLPTDPNVYDLAGKKLIVPKDQILSVTEVEALEYGITRKIVKDRAGVLEYLAKRDGVNFAGEPMVLETTWSEEVARWLNSPAVMAVLVLLALLGVYIELNTPGLGLPGLVAVICFAIIIGSKYVHGLANWLEVAIFFLGILLLLVEFLVLPGFGIAGISGFICIFAGLFGMLLKNPPDKLPWPNNALDWSDLNRGVFGLSLGFVGFIVLAWLLSKYLPKIPFLGGLVLMPTAAKKAGTMQVSMTTLPESETLNVNIGDRGEVVSTLRPTGKVKFGDAFVDVVAEGEFLNEGTKVEIIGIHGNRVIVQAVRENS